MGNITRNILYPVSAIFLGLLLGYLVSIVVVRTHFLASKPVAFVCPPGWLCIDPTVSICFPTDFEYAKWLRMKRDNRQYISSLARKGLVEIRFPYEEDCYKTFSSLENDGVEVGDYIGSIRIERWRWKKKK